MQENSLYRPPAPTPSSPLRSLLRVIRQGDGDLLSLVPKEAYEEPLTWLGYSRRSILLLNDTELCKEVLYDREDCYPKNDLMVGALEGLVGDSLFVTSGENWRRQRRMIDPAFSQLRINTAFASMVEALDDYETILDEKAASGSSFSLDKAMSHLTADIICRSIFSQPLDSAIAGEVFSDFLLFERSVASVNLGQLIFAKPWSKVKQPDAVVQACQRIRHHIGTMLDPRLDQSQSTQPDDIVAAVIAARDTETGQAFSREELIDQLGVFFLAGHETTASVLTWVFFILSQQPEVAARIASDVERIVSAEATGDAMNEVSNEDTPLPMKLEHIRQLPFVRNVFRETLRLYPPITFLPRVALKKTQIGDKRVKRGAMIMVSPWTAHRNRLLWTHPDRFDPQRFDPERSDDKGVHLSFGIGPRVCIGASFATTEAILIIAKLAQRYRFETLNPHSIRPVARLTTRPAEEVQMRVHRR